jgi:sugar/nucleoside kinase (ribokinase family)
VLCCGNLVRDILVGPIAETAWGKTVWVESIEEDFGGNGANTSYALAKLGASVRLMGMLGADEAGSRVLSRLESAGVDTTQVQRCDLPTPTSIVLVNPNGARALLHRPGASREAFSAPVELTPEVTAGCDWFHLANVFALPSLRPHAARLLESARKAGLSVSVDTGWDARGEWMDVLRPCLPYTDLLFVNEDEARELTSAAHPIEAARALQEHGVRNVVLKLGAAGCVMLLGDESVASPGFQVSVVDTTGAGDCFVGGFLAALLRGLPYADAAHLANAVGALSVQKLGSTAGLLSFEETVEWVKAQQNSRLP